MHQRRSILRQKEEDTDDRSADRSTQVYSDVDRIGEPSRSLDMKYYRTKEKPNKLPSIYLVENYTPPGLVSTSDRERSGYNDLSSSIADYNIFSRGKTKKTRDVNIRKLQQPTLSRREKSLVPAVDRCFDQLVDKFFEGGKSLQRHQPRRLDSISKTFKSEDYETARNEQSSFLMNTNPFDKKKKPKHPLIRRKDILDDISADYIHQQSLVGMIYQNHPKKKILPESSSKAHKTGKYGMGCLMTDTEEWDFGMDELEKDALVKEMMSSNLKRARVYFQKEGLVEIGQTFNDFFDVTGEWGYRWLLKPKASVLDLRKALRNLELQEAINMRELTKNYEKWKDDLLAEKLKQLKRRLFKKAARRLGYLTEIAIRHSAGYDLIRYLKDTIREDWEWYIKRIPGASEEVCEAHPSRETLLEKGFEFYVRPVVEEEPKREPLARRLAFDATGNPKSNPFGKKLLIVREKQTPRPFEVDDSVAKAGDPFSPMITKLMKGGSYVSYWLKCIDACLAEDNSVEVEKVGYISCLKLPPVGKLELRRFGAEDLDPEEQQITAVMVHIFLWNDASIDLDDSYMKIHGDM